MLDADLKNLEYESNPELDKELDSIVRMTEIRMNGGFPIPYKKPEYSFFESIGNKVYSLYEKIFNFVHSAI